MILEALIIILIGYYIIQLLPSLQFKERPRVVITFIIALVAIVVAGLVGFKFLDVPRVGF